MTKLTDSQLIVLSKAAARDDGTAIFPPGMAKPAAMKVGASLVARKLMRAVGSKAGAPVWRQAEDGRKVSLVITAAGRTAIGVEDVAEDPEPAEATSLDDDKGASSIGGSEPKSAPSQSACAPESGSGVSLTPEQVHRDAPSGADPLNPPDRSHEFRSGSKQALIVDMLAKGEGVTIGDLVQATGWLPHTARAALTGLRKRGYDIERRQGGGRTSIYRIVGAPAPVEA